jgi:hypothetical protein
MQKRFIRRVVALVLLLGSAQTTWGGQAQVYYTYDPMARLENIQTRSVPPDMTAQQFLNTLNPSLPPLNENTIWALATKQLMRLRPGDLVVISDNFHPVGKSSNNPWIITRIAVG